MNTLVLAPALDNRHGVGKVTSRIGLETDAKAFTPEHDLLNLISQRTPTMRCIACWSMRRSS